MSRARDTADQINRINSSAADATAITVDSSENVGIGTSSPATSLHLGGSSDQSFEIDGSLTPTFVGTSGNIGQISVNRRPHDGAFADPTKAAAYINLSSEVGGSTVTFSTTTSNNVNPTERLRILSGGGITFNGDTAAANALSDYEEGTFTATLVGYYSSPNTAVTATGYYTKIGNAVSFNINMDNVDTTGASGDMWITGMPFATSGIYTICSTQMDYAGTFANSSPFGLMAGGILYFHRHVSQGNSPAVFHNAGTGRNIRSSGTYRTA